MKPRPKAVTAPTPPVVTPKIDIDALESKVLDNDIDVLLYVGPNQRIGVPFNIEPRKHTASIWMMFEGEIKHLPLHEFYRNYKEIRYLRTKFEKMLMYARDKMDIAIPSKIIKQYLIAKRSLDRQTIQEQIQSVDTLASIFIR